MRKTPLVAAAVVAVAVLAINASMASSATTLDLVFGPERETKEVAFDTNGNGLRLGERLVGRAPLRDHTQSERLGTGHVECVVQRRIIDPNVGLWNCTYVLKLSDGEIMLQGLDPRGPGVYEMAVLGGTGAYSGASGDATFTDVGSGPDAFTEMAIRLQ
jgi:hypothetical protein